MGGGTDINGNQLVEAVTSLQNWALARWEFSLFIALFGFFRWWWGGNFSEEKSRIGVINFLHHAQAANSYKMMVGWILGITDRWGLEPGQLALRPSVRPAWAIGFYPLCLLLALVYPTLAIYATWPFIDVPIRFGSERYLRAPEDIGQGWTVFALGGCIVWSIATLLVMRGRTRLERLGWWCVAVSAATLAASAQMLAVSVSGYGAAASLVLVAVTTAVCLDRRPAIQGTAALAGIVLAIGVLKLLQHTGLDLPVGRALRSVLGALGLGNLPGGIDGRLVRASLQEALISSAGTAVAAIGLQRLMGDRFFSARQHAVIWIGFVALAMLLAWSTYWRGHIAQLRLVVILPLVNALFDFASLGLTRWALRRGASRVGWRTLGWSLVDLVGALALFIALAWTIIAVLLVFNLAVGFPMTRMEEVFAWWRDEPLSHLWLALSIGSILVPTLVHAMIAIWAIGPVILGRRARQWMARKLDGATNHFGWRWFVLSTLSAWSAFAVAAPIVILSWLVDWAIEKHPTWGFGLLRFFESAYLLLSGL